MTRIHRAWHRLIWIALVAAVSMGFVLALALRPAPAADARPPAQECAR